MSKSEGARSRGRDEALSVSINGEERSLGTPCSLRHLLDELAIEGKVAIAVNREVVPRSEFASRNLCDGDRIEILEAVGGG